MGTLRVSLIALAFATASGAAMAADFGTGIVTEDVAGWDGTYVGIYAGIWPESSSYTYLGGVIGMNKTLDQGVVVGGELQAGMNFNGFTFDEPEFQAVGRIGMAPSDQILLYLSGGVGYAYGLEASVGVGAEFMVTDSMSFRADLSEYIWSASSYESRFTISALWHM